MKVLWAAREIANAPGGTGSGASHEVVRVPAFPTDMSKAEKVKRLGRDLDRSSK
jgi:hypothetical protein